MTGIAREGGKAIYYGYDDVDRLTTETWKNSGIGSIYGRTVRTCKLKTT